MRSALAAVSAHRPAVSDPLFFRPAARAGNSARRPTLTFPEQGRPDRRLCVAWHPMHLLRSACSPSTRFCASLHRSALVAACEGRPRGDANSYYPVTQDRWLPADSPYPRQVQTSRGDIPCSCAERSASHHGARFPDAHCPRRKSVQARRPGDAWVFPVACGLCHIWHNPQCLRSTP